jgi:hypothetical protein
LLEQNNLMPAGMHLVPASLQQFTLRPGQMPTPPESVAATPADNSSSILIVVSVVLAVVAVAILILRRRSRQAPH